MYIDTHVHLLDEKFDTDRDAVLARARERGVGFIVEVACEPAGWQKALEFCRDRAGTACVIGLHPQEARLATPELLLTLRETASVPQVVALGETGFDYYYETSPRETQRLVFLRHLEFAVELDKPLVIHCRQAYPDLIAILSSYLGPASGAKGVIHCFSGTPEEADRLAALGFFIGLDGPVTYPKAHDLRRTVERIPLEQLVIETDSPYLPPQPFRGQRNEPAYVTLVAEEIARIKGVDAAAVARATAENARRLFRLEHKEIGASS